MNSAEQLFHARGYTAVSMRDIADSLAMRQASLYYHVPEGKEQLYVLVVMRNLRRHQVGIGEAIASTENRDLYIRLGAVADWFINNTPLRLLSMLERDIAALSEENAKEVTNQAYLTLYAPIATLFAEAQKRGEIRTIDPTQLAGYFLFLMDGISYSGTSGMVGSTKIVLVRDVLEILLNGLSRQTIENRELQTKITHKESN